MASPHTTNVLHLGKLVKLNIAIPERTIELSYIITNMPEYNDNLLNFAPALFLFF